MSGSEVLHLFAGGHFSSPLKRCKLGFRLRHDGRGWHRSAKQNAGAIALNARAAGRNEGIIV